MMQQSSNASLFANFPPTIAWLVVAITLVAMVQFGSTERLAAAFAWLIFISILIANGQQAFINLATITNGITNAGNTPAAKP